MHTDDVSDDSDVPFDLDWNDKDLHWTTRYYILCYNGNMEGLKKILTEKKDNDIEDSSENGENDEDDEDDEDEDRKYMKTILICIGICHLSGNPEMAAYLIENFSLSQTYLKSQAWLIISKTLDDLSAVRTITSLYGFTKDDFMDFTNDMFDNMCDSIFTQTETMNLYIWAFTELGLSRENGFRALSEAVYRGRNSAASWLINHFNIELIELYCMRPRLYDDEIFGMLMDKYSVIDKILFPFYAIGTEICEYILQYSEPTNTY
jgi:hypothetical protein